MDPSLAKALGRNVRDCSCNCGDDSPDGAVCCPCNCPCGYCYLLGKVADCCPCPPPPPPPKSKTCFPSFAKVYLESGKMIAVRDLQLGDKVQTGMDCGRDAFNLSSKITYQEIWKKSSVGRWKQRATPL